MKKCRAAGLLLTDNVGCLGVASRGSQDIAAPRRRTPGFGRNLSLIRTWGVAVSLMGASLLGQESPGRAFVDGTEPGWRALKEADFTSVNSAADTWTWHEDGVQCSGQPLSVLRTTQEFKNFEMIVEWKHLQPAGNSGVFLWTTPESIERLTKSGAPGLPDGIEIQILDHGYTEQYKARNPNRAADWFTTHGDVFAVRVKLTPFPPTSPNGSRSFPRKHLSRGVGEWNHYYIRAVNGEVRLWVNGEEVSGGTGADPAQGFICLESEGSPIHFRNLRIRELP